MKKKGLLFLIPLFWACQKNINVLVFEGGKSKASFAAEAAFLPFSVPFTFDSNFETYDAFQFSIDLPDPDLTGNFSYLCTDLREELGNPNYENQDLYNANFSSGQAVVNCDFHTDDHPFGEDLINYHIKIFPNQDQYIFTAKKKLEFETASIVDFGFTIADTVLSVNDLNSPVDFVFVPDPLFTADLSSELYTLRMRIVYQNMGQLYVTEKNFIDQALSAGNSFATGIDLSDFSIPLEAQITFYFINQNPNPASDKNKTIAVKSFSLKII